MEKGVELYDLCGPVPTREILLFTTIILISQVGLAENLVCLCFSVFEDEHAAYIEIKSCK